MTLRELEQWPLTDDDRGPLPSRANSYLVAHPEATPDETLREADLPESRREQITHLCAVTRYAHFCDREVNDDEGLRVPTVT